MTYLEELKERIYAKLVPDPATGCLLWTGRINQGGYGRVYTRFGGQLVHRVLWELEVGPIPPGLTIDHVLARGCVHKNCANIAHLEVVTRAENAMRAPGWLGAVRAAQTHCIRGHPFDEANTRPHPGVNRGGRMCRTCHRDASREWARKRARAAS